LKNSLDMMASILSLDVIWQIKASVDNIVNSVANEGYQRHLMDEFDLRKEEENLNAAREASDAYLQGFSAASASSQGCPLVAVVVPTVRGVSADGTALLTQWVEGLNITAYARSPGPPPGAQVQKDLLFALTWNYFNDLLMRRRLHSDQHPGNMIIVQDEHRLRVYVLDRGDELRPSVDEARSMMRLLQWMHMETRGRLDSCEAIWRDLGVESRRPGSEQFAYFCKSFNIFEGMEGLNWKQNVEHCKCVTLPAQVALWQKATSAFVMTLQALRTKFPEWQKKETAQSLIRDALSEVLKISSDRDGALRAHSRSSSADRCRKKRRES